MGSNGTGTGNGNFALFAMQQTETEQYTDEAYAWEVATVRVCFRVCFHPLQCLFLFSTIQRLDEFAVLGFERLDFVSFPCIDGFACFVLHFRNAGPSRRRVEQANLYGLCFAISPQSSCEPRPHISETYQWMSGNTTQIVAENGWFRLFGVQQMGHLVHCWAVRMGIRVFAVLISGRAGSDTCHVRPALGVTC